MIEKIIIVAHDLGFVIGKDGGMPGWKLPLDMKIFKERTTGHIVIMGRKTFESFPEKYRPLPGRINIIISRDKNYQPVPTNEDTYVCTSYEAAIELAEKLALPDNKKIFIIGGGEIYREALYHLLIKITKIIVTEVQGNFEGNTFFPQVENVSIIAYFKDEKNSHDFKIKTYILLKEVA
jgi:dihydrofolate reductase